MHHYHAILCYIGLPAYTVMVEGVMGRGVMREAGIKEEGILGEELSEGGRDESGGMGA